MGREILFRGKKVGSKEWVIGSLVLSANSAPVIVSITDKSLSDGEHWSVLSAAYKVDPETVGQYTGMLDIHGNKIFEGDYFRAYTPGESGGFIVSNVPIRWDAKRMEWATDESYNKDGSYLTPLRVWDGHWIVKGNIHDTPELITKKAQENG